MIFYVNLFQLIVHNSSSHIHIRRKFTLSTHQCSEMKRENLSGQQHSQIWQGGEKKKRFSFSSQLAFQKKKIQSQPIKFENRDHICDGTNLNILRNQVRV